MESTTSEPSSPEGGQHAPIPEQPAREKNIAAIVEYIASGIKPLGETGKLGIELEHTVVDEQLGPVSYREPEGVAWLLEQLSEHYPEKTIDDEGNLIGVARPGETLTLEPAAQLELSAGPYEEIGQIRVDFELFQRNLAKLLAPVRKRALTVGYHPTARSADLHLIPKRRYAAMDAHFATIGDYGRHMMRASASTQVSIDYYSVEDCLRKLRLGFVLAPLFALICDNAPTFEGRPRPHELVRTKIWLACDPARCGVIPGALDPGFTLESYAAFALDAPAVFVPGDDPSCERTERTFGEIYAKRAMTRAEVEHALSLVFTDVRLKTYLELRPADALPVPFVTAYAALVKGLFYSEESLSELDSLFAHVTESDIDQAKAELMEKGYRAHVYGREVGRLVDALLSLARKGLASNEANYLSPLVHLASTRTTLASMAQR